MLKDKKGFTLIELVVVIVIIAILAAILVPSITAWIDKSRFATMKSEADTVRNTISAQIAYMSKDPGVIVSGMTQDDFDDDFWAAVTKDANITLQCKESGKNGYVTFKLGDSGLTELTYYASGHTATLTGSTWNYE